jgi:O-antigen/teichoic acid export membrane protein
MKTRMAHDHRPPARRVVHNTMLRALAEVVGKLASLALFALVARALGAQTLGDYVFALSVGQLIWAAGGFGLDQMALRDIARARVAAIQRLFLDVIRFKLFFGLVALALAVGVLAAIGYPGHVIALVAILGITALLLLLTETAQTVFQAYERMEYYLMAYVPHKVFTALFGITVLAAGAGIVAVALGALVAATIALLVALTLLYRFFTKPKLRGGSRAWASLARSSAPFGIQEIAGIVRYRADVVLLSLLTSSTIVGVYGAAYRLIEATFFLAVSIGQSVLPMFSYLDRRSTPTLDRTLEGSLKLITVVMTPVAVTFLVGAKPVVDLIFGLPQYDDAVPLLRLLALIALLYSLANLLSTFILIHAPRRVTIAVFVAAAVLNVLLCLVLIPLLGAEGAAVATLVSELFLVLAGLALASRIVARPRLLAVGGGSAAAGLAMAGMVSLFGESWLALLLGLIMYVAVLLLFEARSAAGDIEITRAVLRMRPRAETALGKPPARVSGE